MPLSNNLSIIENWISNSKKTESTSKSIFWIIVVELSATKSISTLSILILSWVYPETLIKVGTWKDSLINGSKFKSKILGFFITNAKLVIGYINKDGSICKIQEPIDLNTITSMNLTEIIQKIPKQYCFLATTSQWNLTLFCKKRLSIYLKEFLSSYLTLFLNGLMIYTQFQTQKKRQKILT